MDERRYDLAILGAGPAGYAAAMRAHDVGKRVALIERSRIGGTGLHAGALSSKTMWHLSNDYATACRGDRGFKVRDIEVSYGAVMSAVREAVDERRTSLAFQLEHLVEPSPAGGQVDLIQGTAKIIAPHQLEITKPGEPPRVISADNLLIATGSTPRRPDGIEIDGDRILTSDHIEELGDFPASMVVVGAGVVGCEYATIFANFGKTRIDIIDRQPRILPFEDEDVAAVVGASFEAMGMTIHREAKLESMRVKDGMVEYVLRDASGILPPIRVERALVSVGRIPTTSGLGLETIGVTLDKSGGIAVTNTQSNSVSHVYAAGDATMDIALANVAELEGRHAVERMFGLSPTPLRYEALSAIMFLSPEVASVGLNEQQAKQKGIAYRVGSVSNSLINRNIAMRKTTGFLKLLARRDSGKVLGLRVVGPEASSTIQGIAFLIDQGATIADIDTCVHPHPAITEGVQECARLLLGRSIHKAEVFGKGLLRLGEG